MQEQNVVTIYVPLLEEGSSSARGTDAVVLGENLYRILATADYDAEDEVWEFPPGTIVRCEETESARGNHILLAVEQVKQGPEKT